MQDAQDQVVQDFHFANESEKIYLTEEEFQNLLKNEVFVLHQDQEAAADAKGASVECFEKYGLCQDGFLKKEDSFLPPSEGEKEEDISFSAAKFLTGEILESTDSTSDFNPINEKEETTGISSNFSTLYGNLACMYS